MKRLALILLVVSFAGAGWLTYGGTPPDGKKNGKPPVPIGLGKRVPWTTSRIKGTPEPPPPYRSERAFPAMTFNQPVLLTFVPGTKRLVVAEQAGRIYTFRDEQKCDKKDLFIDLKKEITNYDKNLLQGVAAVYGLTFHPKFESNRLCYICYIQRSKKGGEHPEDGTRVSSFRVTNTDPPRVDPSSEKILLTYLEGGHNGGCLKFGHDNYLYISTGDATAPSPPDGLDTGQDCSDLLSSILRIDVDRSENGKPYAVPKDNPFVNRAGVRPEIWAFGFRNPWRMSFDRKTGDLWVGDVGWELWEMVYRVVKGGNYGWSVMEASQPVRPNSRRGPAPILPPTLAFPHTEAASITGGFVYWGKRYPKLRGTYICGDWETKTIWGSRWDGKKIVSLDVLAQTSQRIVAFGEDKAGEIYIVDYDPNGGIYHLVPNDAAKDLSKSFPRKLSQTGLFANTAKQVPSPGVIPFSINAEQWTDHATAERWIAIPGNSAVHMFKNNQTIPRSMFRGKYFFPADSVLVKTSALEMKRGDANTKRKIETQIMHFDGMRWHGYSYRWNNEQTDAELVPASGTNQIFKVADRRAPGGSRQQTWRFFGRGQCLQCHNPWAGFNLAFTPEQLDRDHDYGHVVAGQLLTLEHINLIADGASKGKEFFTNQRFWTSLANPYNDANDLEQRARSYLHANCAHCHQRGAGGTATINLLIGQTLGQAKCIDIAPVQGAFAIDPPRIIAPGNPYGSVLYYRMATPGQGRMPHIGSQFVDVAGLKVIHDWIQRMPSRPVARERIVKLKSFNKNRRAKSIRELLQSTPDALLLLQAVEAKQLPDSVCKEVIELATDHPHVPARDLFERFVPDARKIKRLGDDIDPKIILALNGKAARGKQLFFGTTSTCVKCHRAGGEGGTIGPDLAKIASKMKRAELLENILAPSKKMDPKYRAHVVVTKSGRVITGQLVEKTAKEMVLRDANDQRFRIPTAEIEQSLEQQISLMPLGLLRDLTAQQAADLLAFLESLQ